MSAGKRAQCTTNVPVCSSPALLQGRLFLLPIAKEWIQKSLANGSDASAVVVEHYGDILYQLGDKEGAINQWKRANKLGEASKFLLQKIEEGKLYE